MVYRSIGLQQRHGSAFDADIAVYTAYASGGICIGKRAESIADGKDALTYPQGG